MLSAAQQFRPDASRVELLRESHNAVYRVACGEERCILPVAARGRKFLATAFSWAQGRNWDERCDYAPETLFSIGEALGKIHRLAKAYTPLQAGKRRLWSESQHLLRAPALLRGYTSETSMRREMLLSLQSFFRIRDFIYLSSILEKNKKLNGWNKSFVETCADRILNGRPFLEFDMGRALGLL